ncbi:MAG: hypothetical protein JXA71_14915 [Chitinispirillaceae bacterium]|nr:hypothetical protein [Chitinispirillaceae bacterium]
MIRQVFLRKRVALVCAVVPLLTACASPSLHHKPPPLISLPKETEITPEQESRIDSLALQVDSLTARFLRLQEKGPLPGHIKKKWLALTREAEAIQKEIPANKHLLFLLGELYRIAIFFGVPDAAESAEFYLTQCVGLHGRDYRPYLLLAWLYLRRGCQFPEKTRYLLTVVDRKLSETYFPYLQMLWGYYYHSCRNDPEKAFGYFISYLAFDPDDEWSRKVYQEIKKELSAKNRK